MTARANNLPADLTDDEAAYFMQAYQRLEQQDRQEREAAEALARAEALPDNQQSIWMDAIDAFEYGMGDTVANYAELGHQLTGWEWMRDASEDVADWAESQKDQMSANGRAAFEREIISEDADGNLILGEGADDADTWILKFGSNVGKWLPEMVLGRGMGSVGTRMTSRVLARSATREALQRGATQAVAERAGSIYAASVMQRGAKDAIEMGTGTLLGVGGATGAIARSAREEFTDSENLSEEELFDSDVFREASWRILEERHGEGVDPYSLTDQQRKEIKQAAREEMGDRAAHNVARDPTVLFATLANAVAGEMGGRTIDRFVGDEGVRWVANKAANQMVSDVGGAVQTGIDNYGVNKQVIAEDVERDPWKDVVQSGLDDPDLVRLVGAGLLAWGGDEAAAGTSAGKPDSKTAATATVPASGTGQQRRVAANAGVDQSEYHPAYSSESYTVSDLDAQGRNLAAQIQATLEAGVPEAQVTRIVRHSGDDVAALKRALHYAHRQVLKQQPPKQPSATTKQQGKPDSNQQLLKQPRIHPNNHEDKHHGQKAASPGTQGAATGRSLEKQSAYTTKRNGQQQPAAIIRNRAGNPFKTRGAAKVALKRHPGYELVRTGSGYELHWLGGIGD